MSQKQYTKKQITEAIAYQEKRLKTMNEDANRYYYAYTVDPYLYVTALNSCFATPVRKVGASHGSSIERENPETLDKKLTRYNTCVTEDWKPAYQIILDDADGSKVFACEKELFELLASSRQGNKELFTADDSAINDAISEFKTRHPTAEIVKYID